MIWTVKIIIPCKCRENMASHIDDSEVLRRSKGLSPLAGFVDLDSNVLLTAEYADLFESSGFEAASVYQRMSLDCFEIKEVFYPYGIVIEGHQEYEGIAPILQWIEEFHKYFSLRTVFSEKAEKPKWSITSAPIFVFETDVTSELIPKPERIHPILDNNGFYSNDDASGIIIENPVVIIPDRASVSDSAYADLITSLKMVCAIESIGRGVRIELKQLGEHTNSEQKRSRSLCQKLKTVLCQPQKEKQDEKDDSDDKYKKLLGLQKKCAIVNELASSAVFGSCQQKRIYDVVKEQFHMEDILVQMDRARTYVENWVEFEENILSKRIADETNRMDKTLFVTGYLGVILSIFGFFPITIRSLIVLEEPITYWQRWIAIVCIIIASVGFCILLVRWFNRYRLCKERTRKILKWVLALLSVILILSGTIYAWILTF